MIPDVKLQAPLEVQQVLLHTCCAPCSVYCIKSLRAEGVEPTLYWYNPNIHPYVEYKARRDCLKKYAEIVGVELIIDDAYGLDEFCCQVANRLETRCETYCYPLRLQRAAQYAFDHGFDAISTTLLYSIYQKHDIIKQLLSEYGAEGILIREDGSRYITPGLEGRVEWK